MKKWIFFILLCGVLFLLIDSNHVGGTEAVFSSYSDSTYIIKEINISTRRITTKNIKDYFSNVTVLNVVCVVPKLYENKINLPTSYTFDETVSLRKNVEELEQKFQRWYKEMGFLKQSESIYFYGILFSKIKVYGSEREIQNIEVLLKK